MKNKKSVWVLCLLAAGLWGSLCFAEADKPEAKPVGNDSFWQEDLSRPEPPKVLSEERLGQFLEHLRRQNPARADELERLRAENPEQFRLEIREEFANRFRQMRQQQEHRERQHPQSPPPGMPAPEAMPDIPKTPGMHGMPGIPGQPGENWGQWRERLEKMHTELLTWLEKNAPDEAVRLKQLREKQPEEYVIRTAELMRKYGPIMRAEKDNPKLAEVMKDDLENQRRRDELLRQIGGATGEEKDKLVAELKTVVARRFDLIMAKKQMQYDDLRKRLEELQKEVKLREGELETQKANKDKAIEEHVAELVAGAKKINWEQP
jgi:hypothetical protein